MSYKQIIFLVFPFVACLLAGGCLNDKQVAILSIPDHKNTLGHAAKIGVSLTACKNLGSISCMKGKNLIFLFQLNGHISNLAPQAEGQVAFIGVPAGVAFSPSAPIVQKAIASKNKIEEIVFQDEGSFIYWNKPTKTGSGSKRWIMKIEADAYKELALNKYNIYMLYAPSGASSPSDIIFTVPLDMDITDNDVPNYQNITLEAISPIQEQTGWFLKGNITPCPTDAKVGFLLIKEGENGYNLVEQVIASESGWPTIPTAFRNEMIIVPAALRAITPSIVYNFPSSKAPMQGGHFNLFCYMIQGNKHYYLSQIEQFLPDARASASSQESAPPSITFTGSNYDLKLLNFNLFRETLSGQVNNVKFSDFDYQYFVNGQIQKPSDALSVAIVCVQKDIIWRTAVLESLFKEAYASKDKMGITDDGTLSLITNLEAKPDLNKLPNESLIGFFSGAAGYEYFLCLFSKKDHKLTFYTQKQTINIEDKAIDKPELPNPEAQNVPDSGAIKVTLKDREGPKITLDNTDANITFYMRWFGSNYVTWRLPKVELIGFDKNQITDRGFVVAKAGAFNELKMDDHNPIINKFIKDKEEVSYDKQFLIFKEDRHDGLKDVLYGAYKDEELGHGTLAISYWAQYKNKTIWSKPVSIPLI